MPLFYHKYVNYVLAHSVNYVITLYRLAPPVAPILVVFANLCKRTLIICLFMNALLALRPCLVSH